MNILLTGASRGIGEATLAALTTAGHRVVGHSTAGSDTLIAADFTDPAAVRRLWSQAFERLDGRIDVLVNNAGVFEGVADNAGDDEWHAAWGPLASTFRPRRSVPPAIASCARGARRPNRHVATGRLPRDSPMHWHYAAQAAWWR